MSLLGGSGVVGELMRPFAEAVVPPDLATIQFFTNAVTGDGEFVPTITTESGEDSIVWNFPDDQNTLGVSTHQGPIPAGFTFLSAGIKEVSVSTELTDRFKTIKAEDSKLVDISLPSELPELSQIWCYSNNIVNLSLPNELPNLTQIRCHSNNIVNLSLPSELPRLTLLWCDSNSIVDLGLPSELPRLTQLRCYLNSIVDLGLPSSLPRLTTLRCYSNDLTKASIDAASAVVFTGRDTGAYDYSNNPGTATADTALLDQLQTAPKAWTLTPQH